MSQHKPIATYLALTTAVVFWGMSFVATKIALDSLSAPAYMFFRFTAASIPFVALLFYYRIPRLGFRVHLKLAAIAFFEPGLYFIFETTGLQRTSAPKASIIIAMTPVVVALLSRLFLGERLSRRTAAGAALSIVGVVILVLADPAVALNPGTARLGDLLVGFAVLSAALYMLVVRSVKDQAGTFHITALQVIYGAAIFAVLYFVTPGRVDWTAVGTEAVGAIVFLAIFATIGAFFAYNFALSQVTAGQASIALNGIPVVTAITAWLVLGEKLTLVQAAGGLLVLLGVTVANLARASRRRRGKVEPETTVQEPYG